MSPEEVRVETRAWLEETVVVQAEQIAAVLALHKSDEGECCGYAACVECEVLWPCPTASALEVRA